MEQKKDKQFILVAVKGKMHRPVFGPATAAAIGSEKKKLKASGNWRGWELNIRDPEAYKKVPILTKPLTFEQKLQKIKA